VDTKPLSFSRFKRALRLQRSAERIDFHWFVAVWIPKSSQWFMGEMKVCEKLVKWIRCKRFLKSVQVTLKKGHLLDIFQLFLLTNRAFGDVHIPSHPIFLLDINFHAVFFSTAFRLRLHPCMGRLPRASLAQDSPMADTSTWVQRAKESKPSDMKSLMVIWVPWLEIELIAGGFGWMDCD